MQVWPRAACCDVRETERVRGRKREVGGERRDGVRFTVFLCTWTPICVEAHAHVYTHLVLT